MDEAATSCVYVAEATEWTDAFVTPRSDALWLTGVALSGVNLGLGSFLWL